MTAPPRAAAPLLVVAPHATRTGSTRVLIDLLVAAAPDLGLPLCVLLQSGGALAADLQALGPPPRLGELPAAVLVNTCLAADHLDDLDPSVPATVYVHETGDILEQLPAPARRGLLRADLVLSVSDLVTEDLVAMGVDRARIVALPPVVAPPRRVGEEEAAACRARLGIGPEAVLVLGCGEASERKGTDLFVEAIGHLADRPDLHAAWVGRRLRSVSRLLDHDVEALGLAGRVHWVEEVPDTAPYLAAADVLAMTSRYDPQPLVPVEAAAQGCPTVGFSIGGVAELAAAGAARTVAFPDTQGLARAIEEVATSAAERHELVEAARQRLHAQAPDRVVPRFVAAIGALLAGSPTSQDRS